MQSIFKRISMGFRLCAILVPAFAVASCVTTDPRLIAALQQTSVREIRIETTPDLTAFPERDQKLASQQLADATRVLKATMTKDLVGLPGGPVPGRLVVTLHVFDVTTKKARVIGGHDSSIDGTVRLENARTGELIAEAQNIHGEDLSMRGSGYGVIVAVAVNAMQTSGSPDVMAQRLSDSFTSKVKQWLLTKK
ncbi:hypothetical protein [Rhizobium lusitanum]|uniref:hypothetical protein n=1 Tax=Rhizobium lusitanum TaxID=293958 RepID=UPI00257440BC|nr:hypothetical protein [Rhizobium lusitanum]